MFLLCYKISDPISLYNVKNKWIRELRKHRQDVPVVLCGCQADLRTDPGTLNHLSKTGRTPVSSDQALAICCEIEAVNYVETSAKHPFAADGVNAEAFELCALAAIKQKNNLQLHSCNTSTTSQFKRSPSLNSSLSLFEPSLHHQLENNNQNQNNNNNNNHNKKSHHQFLRQSYRRQASLVAPPPLNSPSSFSECDARLSTFSPEPLRGFEAAAPRIPPSISENEAYLSDTNMSVSSFQTFQQQPQPPQKPQRPASLYSSEEMQLPTTKNWPPPPRERPTTLFKAASPAGLPVPMNNNVSCYNPQTLITPSGDPNKRLQNHVLLNSNSNTTTMVPSRRFDSLSELGPPSSTCHPAMIRPNCLTRRTSYRTYQKVPIPVAAPMSPVGSDYSLDLKSPTSSQCFSPVPRLEAVNEVMEAATGGTVTDHHHHAAAAIPVFEKTYESLKSTCSSQNSSKASSTASAASSADLSAFKLTTRPSPKCLPDTENPELLKNLNFVSPKTGVYRPMPEGSRRYKQSCNVM